MKKTQAFTIVELAIVLVVIGIIIAVTLKSLSLVDSAKLRREMTGLDQMKSAVLQYYSANKSLPTDELDNSKLDITKLVEMGTISESMFTSDLSNSNWELVFCSSTPLDANEESFYEDNSTGEYVCARTADADGAAVPTNGKFVCTVDRQEDRNLKKGYSRVADGSPTITDNSTYDSCLTNTDTYDFRYRVY
jgi:type II secretory pathway pseudopilin PulG